MLIENLINAVIYLGLGIGGWFAKMLHTKIETMQQDIDEFKLKVAENYVKHDAIKELKQEIKQDFISLSGKLDTVINHMLKKDK